MPTVKGPIKIIANTDNKEFFKKLEDKGIKVKLPFSAKKFETTRHPVEYKMIPPTPNEEEPPSEPKSELDKMLDNYLDQNTRVVRKAIKEDDFDDETLEKLWVVEKATKNRKTVIKALKNRMGG